MIYTGEQLYQVSWGDFIKTTIASMIRSGRVVPPQVAGWLQRIPLAVDHPALTPYINHGRWVVNCPFCQGAEVIWNDDLCFLCLSCFNNKANFQPIKVTFPKLRQTLEQILNKRPLAANRNWAGESVQQLKDENKLAGVR